MKNYIKNIKDCKPINYQAFLTACQKAHIGNELFREIFSVSREGKLRKNHYMITVKDNSLFEQYFARYSHVSSDLKVTAALHGNSKTKKINGGILNFKHHLSEPHGISICFCGQSTTFKPTTEDLLIVENLNNFLNPTGTVTGVPIEFNQMNVIWGSGTDITSEQYLSFLKQYKTIYCFLDYDLGGFKAFKGLNVSLPQSKVIFYQHPMLKEYLEMFGNTISEEQYLELIRFENSPGLEDVISLILSLKSINKPPVFLEQETLQYHLENIYGN